MGTPVGMEHAWVHGREGYRGGHMESGHAHGIGNGRMILFTLGTEPVASISLAKEKGKSSRADLNRHRWIQSPEC